MKSKKWITGHWSGDWVAAELLWFILAMPLLATGLWGWVVLGILVVALAFYSKGKVWYKCPNCNHKDVVKS